jgi:hypothetical protein
MSFRLSMRGRALRRHVSPGCSRHSHPDATLFEVSLCLPTAPALPLWGTELRNVAIFWQLSGQQLPARTW